MITTFPDNHRKAKDSQVLIAITGTPEYIEESLLNLASQIRDHRYEKIIQGTIIENKGVTSVSTPIWNSELY